MKYVRPFNPKSVAPGQGESLLAASEGAGCAIELRRGGADAQAKKSDEERFALVLDGEVELVGDGAPAKAGPGDLIFVPAGATAALRGGAEAVWIGVSAPPAAGSAQSAQPQVAKVDQTRFEGEGFAHQSLVDRSTGASSMRMNVLQVQPGSGSPDFHIHAFAQIYVIQGGEMTLDIGRQRLKAGASTLVVLPPGVVHRNFNGGSAVERHVSLLVPEPKAGEIFDYAVTIHENEAELLQQVPN